MTDRMLVDHVTTEPSRSAVTRVIAPAVRSEWVRPNEGDAFFIDADAQMPTIEFEVRGALQTSYIWSWRVEWEARVSGLRERQRGRLIRTFTLSGSSTTDRPVWTVELGGATVGGTLTVDVRLGNMLLSRSVVIKGTNPTREEIKSHLATLPDTDGLEKIVEKESRFRHFIALDGEPVVAFDGGYGLTQMTNPAPDYVQVWDWKQNIESGSALYQEKQRAARAYLGRSGRAYTDEQLRLETWCRWNGGAYHAWDPALGAWIRNPNVLCATGTGNIGWDIRTAANSGLDLGQLMARDQGTFGNPASRGTVNDWKYFGVCYADSLNSG